ncbi:class I SAM-dependent methyltransferase [Streptomyces sp. NPDC005648]|uniref:class I SAM-dependent methyltransferase n=1 Tax=Streptomyces sp. NPDC005648 TaxID=3157044 RepID=UPI0033B56106
MSGAAVPPTLTVAQTDALADRMLDHCRERGVLPPAPQGLWQGYHRLRSRLYETVTIPDTHLTPLAARLLYGIAVARRPRRLAVLGCYAGNLLSWVAGPGFAPQACYPGIRAVGLDVDAAAVALAERNLRSAGYAPGAVAVCADAYAADDFTAQGPWDLVLIDVDEPGARKAGYHRVLERWAPHLAPGAVVVAHDVRHPAFADDLAGYAGHARGQGAVATTTLPVDVCGLEVSRWPGPSGSPA